MSDNGLWDEHAQWWIDGFTDGADPEYVEQIIPLAVEELAGRHKVLDIGCGDGIVSRELIKNKCKVYGCDFKKKKWLLFILNITLQFQAE